MYIGIIHKYVLYKVATYLLFFQKNVYLVSLEICAAESKFQNRMHCFLSVGASLVKECDVT